MWSGPTGGSASRRSCGKSGGGGSGWAAACCWRWTGAGGLPPSEYSRLIRPPNPNSSNLLLPWPPVNGGDQRGVSKSVTHFDAILVDEGQDFSVVWWDLLAQVRRDGGEMLLVADCTQDLYGRASRWNKAFRGGHWFPLEGSYRFPSGLVPHLRTFVETLLPGGEVILAAA